MTTWFGSFPALLGTATLLATSGCGNASNNSATQTEGGSEATASSTTSEGPTTSGSNSESNSSSATEGTGSASMTSLPTTGDPTSAMTASSTDTESSSTTTPVSTTETTDSTSTTSPDTTSTTDPDTTSTSTSTTGESESDSDSSSTTGPDCIPSAEVCNDLDDDCNGIVDDLDIAGDGICDCLNIALFGNPGSNPSAQFQTWLEAQGTQVDRIQTDNTPLTKEILNQYDIVILDWLVRTYTPQEAALLETWVTNGGGLMSMTGHTNNNTVIDRPNSLFGPMGLSYNGSQGFFNGPITQWLKPHPLTEGITSVSFYGGLFINIVEDGIGSNETIGTLPQGPVVVAQTRKAGKLYIFGDEWIEFDSEWQQIPEIKQLWVNILAWLSPQNFCTVPQ